MMELEWHKHIAIQGRDVHVQFDMVSDEIRMPEDYLLEYIRNNEAYMLVYDVMDQESFDVVDQICRLYARIPRQRPWRVPFFIVASKIDRWRGGWAVPFLKGDEFAKSVGATFLPMSALNGEGTGDEVILDMVSRVLLSRHQNEVDTLPRAETRMEVPDPVAVELPSPSLPHDRRQALKAPSIRPSLWQRAGPGLLRLLHRSGRLLEWFRPKQSIHHWDTPATQYADRNDSFVSMDSPHVQYEQPRTRSLTGMSYHSSRNTPYAVEQFDEPPLPPHRFGDAARLNRPVRHSRTMSLEMALSPEFFQQVRSQTPVS